MERDTVLSDRFIFPAVFVFPAVTPEQLYEQDERRREWDEFERKMQERRARYGQPEPVEAERTHPRATLDLEEVRDYLDDAIRMWRKKRDAAEEGGPVWAEACCYVDAFQSVRLSLLGIPLIEE